MQWHEIVSLIVSIISAVGTFGAAAVALYLACQGNRQRIDCAFMWESATNDKPTLILNNISHHTVIVKVVALYFHRQEIAKINILSDPEYCNNAIIAPNKECRIVINIDSLKTNIKGKPVENPDTIYKLTAIVETTAKKKYKSSYQYCYNEILGLCFTAGFYDE